LKNYNLELEPIANHQSAKPAAKWVYHFKCNWQDADRLLFPTTGLYHIIIPENVIGIGMSNTLQPYLVKPASAISLSAIHKLNDKTLSFSGIAFYPHTFYSVLANQVLEQNPEFNPELTDLLSSRKKLSETTRILSDWFTERSYDSRSHSMMATAIGIMKTRKGNISVNRLAEILNTSPRHLRRNFRTTAGISPKTYLDVLRLAAFLRGLENQYTLQHIALQSGFYDLSHLHQKLKQYLGLKPKDLTEGNWTVIKELMDG